MTEKRRVTSSVATHFPNQEAVKVEDSEFEVENHQELSMLLDPEDFESGPTHSSGDVKFQGPRKAPTTAAVKSTKRTAALHDEELPTGGRIAQIDNDVDPSTGYLEKEAGMPVINNASSETPAEEDEDEFDEAEINSGADEEFAEDEGMGEDVHAEFEDLAEMNADLEDGDMDPLEAPEEENAEMIGEDAPEQMEEPAPFEKETGTESIALVDADEVPDESEEECTFATVANVVHVIRSNRIVASMGIATAKKVGVADIYQTSQFQDVVAHAIETKGLRKGLVQSGFVLAKVKIAANKATAKVVEARVQSSLNKKVEAMAQREKAMEQCMAIAAVGINRRFFKDATNELKAGLETEFTRAGVRGASNIIRAMFAQYGVSYARSILTLANKLSEMPEAVRNQYASALDLTNDEDFEAEEPVEEEGEEGEEFEPIPASVTAALNFPARRQVGALLKAGVKTTAAMSILSGDMSLV